LKSCFERKFRDFYRQLPLHVQRRANKSFDLFVTDNRHPSLQFKCVDKSQSKYSIRINNGYRALGYVYEDSISWYWIGPHDEYMRQIRK
jgi:hypothetical protein